MLLVAAPRATRDGGFLRDYRAIFQYVADNEDIPEDKPDLFTMAAESVLDYVQTGPGQWFLVVKPELLNKDHISMSRGAQETVRSSISGDAEGFEVLGITFVRLQLRTTSHDSAGTSHEAVYEVEGHRLVKK